jgi:hypothetical protein
MNEHPPNLAGAVNDRASKTWAASVDWMRRLVPKYIVGQGITSNHAHAWFRRLGQLSTARGPII